MSRAAKLVRERGGSAAAEMALTLPILLILAFGAVELGLYFWSEHILLQGVRGGAVFASRQPISSFDCGTDTVAPEVIADAKNVTRSGALSGGSDRLALWDDSDTQFAITMDCFTAVNGVTLRGIYSSNDDLIPVITVTASLPYRPLVAELGFPLSASLNAMQQATVTGL